MAERGGAGGERRLRRAARGLRGAADLYWGAGVADDVPALAWFIVSALVPLALGITAVASIALGDYARAQQLAARVAHVLPADVSDQLVTLILRTHRDSPILIAISIGGMLLAGAAAVDVVERTMSRLLGRSRFGFLLGMARRLGLAGALVTIVVLMVLAASKTTDLQDRLGFAGPLLGWLFSLSGLVSCTLVCALLYRHCPRGGTRWRAAWAGALPAGVALTVTPTLVAYYLSLVAGTTPVHLFLVLAGVLFTCYLAAVALLVGAAIAARREAHGIPTALG